MHEPRTPEDEKLDEQDNYYPYSKRSQKSAAEKVYQGDPKRNLPVHIAKFVIGHQSRTGLIDAIHSLDDDPKDQLCESLNRIGISCDYQSVAEVATEALFKILEARSKRNEGFDFSAMKAPEATAEPLSTDHLTEIYIKDGVLHLKDSLIRLPAQLSVPDVPDAHEYLYVGAICEAYADALGRESVTSEDVPTLPQRFKSNYSSQRKAYYAAESVRRSVRDVIDDGDNQFAILEEEAYAGIEEAYWADYNNGFERLNAVLMKMTNTSLNKSTLVHIANLIGPIEKKGLCHIMVNEERIKSWVNIDG